MFQNNSINFHLPQQFTYCVQPEEELYHVELVYWPWHTAVCLCTSQRHLAQRFSRSYSTAPATWTKEKTGHSKARGQRQRHHLLFPRLRQLRKGGVFLTGLDRGATFSSFAQKHRLLQKLCRVVWLPIIVCHRSCRKCLPSIFNKVANVSLKL